MKPAFITLHHKALRRILFATVSLAFLFGVVSYFFELETIDERVVYQAKQQLPLVRHILLEKLQGADSEVSSKEQALLLQQFDMVELYDANKAKLRIMATPKGEEIDAYLDTLPPHTFPKDGSVHYKRYKLPDGSYFWQVMLPIFDTDDKLLGFMEGIYHPSEEDQAVLFEQVGFVVGIVMLAVILTGGIIYPFIQQLIKAVEDKAKSVLKGNVELMEVLGEAVAKRDSDTDIHNYRVTLYALKLAETLGLNRELCQRVVAGAFLHDVGKIAIPDQILLKPGKLTDEEFEIMKTHVSHGADILKRVSWLDSARDIPLYHHEKYDGSGYMKGLKGGQIPFLARLFAIVDVFDALTSERPYKKPMSVEKALAILEKDAGTHFDPEIVKVFIQHAPQWYEEIYQMPDEHVRQRLREKVLSLFEAEAYTVK